MLRALQGTGGTSHWNQGHTNAARLFEEIRDRGHPGKASMVRAYLRQFRATAHVPAPPRKPPAPRPVAAWIMTDPASMDPHDQARLDTILTASPELESLAGHVRTFATMMTELKGETEDRAPQPNPPFPRDRLRRETGS